MSRPGDDYFQIYLITLQLLFNFMITDYNYFEVNVIDYSYNYFTKVIMITYDYFPLVILFHVGKYINYIACIVSACLTEE